MFIMTKQAVLFHRPDGVKFAAPNGFMGSAPDWIGETRQFREQVADGKIIVTETTKDKEIQKAKEKAEKTLKKNRAKVEEAANTEETADKPAETEENSATAEA